MQRRFVAAAVAAGLLFAGSASAEIKIGFHAPQSGPAAADGLIQQDKRSWWLPS